MPEGRTDNLQLTYIPQLLAVFIQYQYIYPTEIYPTIVGSIYPKALSMDHGTMVNLKNGVKISQL